MVKRIDPAFMQANTVSKVYALIHTQSSRGLGEDWEVTEYSGVKGCFHWMLPSWGINDFAMLGLSSPPIVFQVTSPVV